MIYIFLVGLQLIGLINGQAPYEPLTIYRSIHWKDLVQCDNTGWYFDNVDPAVSSVHRAGTEDMTGDVCYRGEWSDSGVDNTGNDRDNLYGAAQWVALEDDGVTPINNFMLSISGRMYGYCDYEPSDYVGLELAYQWIDDGLCPICAYDDNWNAYMTVFEMEKNRNNCDNWSGQLTNSNTDWLSEVTCTNGNNGVSCYWDYQYTVMITGGNRFELKWYANLDNGFSNEAWAFGEIHLAIVNEQETGCCTGTRNDHPNKSCSAFGEQRNCESKGCFWHSEYSYCNIECCRKINSDSKRKPKCKTITNALERCGVGSRTDCEIRMCDCNGFWDGLTPPDGDPCPPIVG